MLGKLEGIKTNFNIVDEISSSDIRNYMTSEIENFSYILDQIVSTIKGNIKRK